MHNVFRIMTPSSRVVLRGIRLPFELVCRRHRWTCYYSNLSEFGGKEGLSLWHTSCPLKRPTERWLCRPYFLAFPLMPVREEEVEGGFRAISRTWTPKPPINPHYQGYSLFLPDTQSNQRINGVNISLLLRHLSDGVEIRLLIIVPFFHYGKKCFIRTKLNSLDKKELSDWCKYLFA